MRAQLAKDFTNAGWHGKGWENEEQLIAQKKPAMPTR
jgi:hypothetical protein